jgi:hypothetical protein
MPAQFGDGRSIHALDHKIIFYDQKHVREQVKQHLAVLGQSGYFLLSGC